MTITKVWAPTLQEIQQKVEEMDRKTDRIVIQALTRDIGAMSADDLATATYETVEKCLLKCEKVIV